VRYRLLETVRDYAAQHLLDSGELNTARDRQLAWSVDFAERAEDRLWGQEAITWFDLLATELDNLRVALRWALTGGRVKLGMRLASALKYFWTTRGDLTEGRSWLSDSVRMTTLATAGYLAYSQADDSAALSLGEEAVALARQAGDIRALGWALQDLGRFQIPTSRSSDAHDHIEEAIRLGRETGDQRLVESATQNMARLEIELGHYEAAKRYAEECISMCEVSGNLRTLANASERLAAAEIVRGNYQRAMTISKEMVQYHRKRGDKISAAFFQGNVGRCLLDQGHYQEARPYLEESLAFAKAREGYAAHELATLAELHLEQGDPTTAADLLDEAVNQMTAQENDDLSTRTFSLLLLGNLAQAQRNATAALEYYRHSLRVACQAGNRVSILDSLEAMATSLADQGNFEQAAQLLAGTDRDRHDTFTPRPPYRQSRYTHVIEQLKSAIPDVIFATAWTKGQAIPLSEAANHALEFREQPPP
jgi:tetratricopeptide (TPR) repeat protein